MEDVSPEELKSFWDHVGELRVFFLLGGGFFIAVATFLFLYGGDYLLSYLTSPLNGETLYFLSPLGPLLFKMHIALSGGVILSFPFWLALFLSFIWPALPQTRRIFLLGVGCVALLLSVGAVALTYTYFFPTTLSVLKTFAVPHSALLLTAESYLSFFLLELTVLFVVFQLPVCIVMLAYLRVLNPRVLTHNRRLFYVGIIVVLAILTPTTDAVTLAIVSIPTVILAEIGIAVARYVYN